MREQGEEVERGKGSGSRRPSRGQLKAKRGRQGRGKGGREGSEPTTTWNH